MPRYDSSESEDDFGSKKEPKIEYRLPNQTRMLLLQLAGFLKICEMLLQSPHSLKEAMDLRDKIGKHLQEYP